MRGNFSRTPAFILVLILSLLITFCAKQEPIREKIDFNKGWKFFRGNLEIAVPSNVIFDDALWEEVTLPHAPKITPLRHPWPVEDNKGINWYQKHFKLSDTYQGYKLFIEFEGADQVTDVWFNGKHMVTHEGSFLPFRVDITDDFEFNNKSNLLTVRVFNTENRDIPVYGNWISYGGLYRDVYLTVTDHLHITDPIYANKTAGGGDICYLSVCL